MSQSSSSQTAYKRTTDKQYSLLTHEMARFRIGNYSHKNADCIIHWNTLTEKLNALGPPYRTVQQWKKVWTDFKRFHSKRNFKSIPKFTKALKNESNIGCDLFGTEDQEEDDEIERADDKPDTSTKVARFLRSEWEECDQNSQSLHSTNSNDYIDDYSFPDGQTTQQLTPKVPETLIPDESPSDYYIHGPPDLEEKTKKCINRPPVVNNRLLPPLRPSNNGLLDQTLYTLQHQIENQTKLLEHISQISGTMAGLMERQVNAVEQQTEALRRQALATEHHTLVMNSFIDMIREKMPKTNSKTPTTSSSNLPNGSS